MNNKSFESYVDPNECFANDDWNYLLYSASIGDVDNVKKLLQTGSDANFHNQSRAVPQVTVLHIAAKLGNIKLAKAVLPFCNVNQQDQWGFTALHYAAVTQNKELIKLLLSNGASAAISSKNGTTAADIATNLKHNEIKIILSTKLKQETDPTIPMFRAWLESIHAEEYLDKFLEEGYDLEFISKVGLQEKDMICIGLPETKKLGLRRKLMSLYNLEKFYKIEKDDEDEEEEGEGDDDDEEDEDED